MYQHVLLFKRFKESQNLIETLKRIKKHKYEIIATSLLGANENIYDIDCKKKVIIIGNESNGVSKEL